MLVFLNFESVSLAIDFSLNQIVGWNFLWELFGEQILIEECVKDWKNFEKLFQNFIFFCKIGYLQAAKKEQLNLLLSFEQNCVWSFQYGEFIIEQMK